MGLARGPGRSGPRIASGRKVTIGAGASRARAVVAAPRKAAPRPRDLQREQTRRAVLDSALIEFSRCGFEGATTRQIAERAGVNHAMIQYYFKSKDALWKEAVQFLFRRLNEEVSFDLTRIERDFGGDTRAFARVVLTDYIRYCARHPEHARLMIQESVRPGARLSWMTRYFTRVNRLAAEALIRRLQADGVLPPGSPAAMTYIIVGASQLYYALAPEARLAWGVDTTQEAAIVAHVEAVLAIFTR